MKKIQTKNLFKNLKRHDATFLDIGPLVKKAIGSKVVDMDGKSFIDFTSGILFANIGHSNKHVINNVVKTLNQSLVNTYILPTTLKSRYVKSLCNFVSNNLTKTILSSSGSEAVDTAIKCLFLYGQKIKKRKNIIISLETNWHGRTMAAEQLCSAKKVKSSWIGDFSNQFKHIKFPYPDQVSEKDSKEFFFKSIKNLKKQINFKKDVVAFFLEGFQGWTSAFYPKRYIEELKKFAKKNDILICFDEVQSGFGRTGKKFAFNHFNLKPDLICTAKGMASGFPISAVLMNKKIYENIKHRKRSLGSTYCGNAVSVSAALATLEVFKKEKIIEKSRKNTIFFQKFVKDLKKHFPEKIEKIYGIGMVAAIHLKKPENNDKLRELCLKKRVLLLKNNNIKLCPPLNISLLDLKKGLKEIKYSLSQLN